MRWVKTCKNLGLFRLGLFCLFLGNVLSGTILKFWTNLSASVLSGHEIMSPASECNVNWYELRLNPKLVSKYNLANSVVVSLTIVPRQIQS